MLTVCQQPANSAIITKFCCLDVVIQKQRLKLSFKTVVMIIKATENICLLDVALSGERRQAQCSLDSNCMLAKAPARGRASKNVATQNICLKGKLSQAGPQIWQLSPTFDPFCSGSSALIGALSMSICYNL